MPLRPPSPGVLVDNKYRLAERIGGGGMGDVFRAETVLGARPVAIKFLHPELAQNMEVSQRFFQEAQAVTKIRHPNVVEVLDAGTGDMGPYIVMEYLEGESVGSALSRVGRFDVDAVVATAVPVLEALDAAHRVGIIHRDLKPENVFIAFDSARGTTAVRLLDFGIAKVLDASGPSPRTRTGVVFGTPDYLSPEQATGDGALDGRSDLFAVGVLIYELVTGLRPFRAPTAVATAFKVVHADAPSIGATGVHVDPRLESIVHRLLQKEPSRRFPAAPEVIRELDKITPDPLRRAVALARVVGAVRRLAQGPPTIESERVFTRESTATRHPTPSLASMPTQQAPRSVPAPRVADSTRAPWPSGDIAKTVRSAATAPAPQSAPSPAAFTLGDPRERLSSNPGDPRERLSSNPGDPRERLSSNPGDAAERLSTTPGEARERPSIPDGPSSLRATAARPFPTRFAGRFRVRGPVLRCVDKVILDIFGAVARDQVVAQMPEAHAAEFRSGSINALVAYELEALDAYMERATALLLRDGGRWRDFGRLAVDGELHNVVRTLLRPAGDAGGVVRRGVTTWARLFSFGTWRVSNAASGKVTLTIGELDAVAQPLRLWLVGVVEQTTRRAVRADLRVVVTGGEQDFEPDMTCEIG